MNDEDKPDNPSIDQLAEAHGADDRPVTDLLTAAATIPAAVFMAKVLTAAPPARAMMLPIFLYVHMMRTKGRLQAERGEKVTYAQAFTESIKMFGEEAVEMCSNIVTELKNIDDDKDGKVSPGEVLDAVGNVFKSMLPGTDPEDRMMGPVLDALTTGAAWEAATIAGSTVTGAVNVADGLARSFLEMLASIPVGIAAVLAGSPARHGEKPRDEKLVSDVIDAFKKAFDGGDDGPGDNPGSPTTRFAARSKPRPGTNPYVSLGAPMPAAVVTRGPAKPRPDALHA